jgi:uncharacterized protein YcbK (DUF882 family)
MCDPSSYSFVERDALESASVVFPGSFAVVQVLGMRRQAQVVSAVIQGITVNVIDLLSTGGIDDQSVHEDCLAIFRVDGVKRNPIEQYIPFDY